MNETYHFEDEEVTKFWNSEIFVTFPALRDSQAKK